MKIKIIASLLTLALLLTITPMMAGAITDEEMILYNKSLINGRNIYYYIDPANEYTATIPAAVQEIMYPAAGFTNRMVLTRTTNWSSSQMDFYQEHNSREPFAAYALSFLQNGTRLESYEKHQVDWWYGEIHFNDYYMDGMTPERRKGTAVHEMLHVYGMRDTDAYWRIGSIMYYKEDRIPSWVTQDANNILNSKY